MKSKCLHKKHSTELSIFVDRDTQNLRVLSDLRSYLLVTLNLAGNASIKNHYMEYEMVLNGAFYKCE